ncbi:MAG: DUF6768 family protein [Pseudomonadota bacterium]
MNPIDQQLQELLSTRDDVDVPVVEPNFYAEVWSSLRGENGAFFLFTWAGILLAGGGLIYCVIQMLRSTALEQTLVFAAFAIMLNSAQIALKLWFNMRLNRLAVLKEIRQLRLQLALNN